MGVVGHNGSHRSGIAYLSSSHFWTCSRGLHFIVGVQDVANQQQENPGELKAKFIVMNSHSKYCRFYK